MLKKCWTYKINYLLPIDFFLILWPLWPLHHNHYIPHHIQKYYNHILFITIYKNITITLFYKKLKKIKKITIVVSDWAWCGRVKWDAIRMSTNLSTCSLLWIIHPKLATLYRSHTFISVLLRVYFYFDGIRSYMYRT
jgi:hypothetical protein